jgi:hypothetical protein
MTTSNVRASATIAFVSPIRRELRWNSRCHYGWVRMLFVPPRRFPQRSEHWPALVIGPVRSGLPLEWTPARSPASPTSCGAAPKRVTSAIADKWNHGGDQPNPRQLHQIGHLIGPQGGGAQPMQLGLDARDLRRQMVEGGQILIDPQPLSSKLTHHARCCAANRSPGGGVRL